MLKQRSLASVDRVVDLRLANPYLSRQRRSSFTINSQIGHMASRKSSFQIDVRLFSKTQVFLQIAADGTVNGTWECTSEYGRIFCKFLNALSWHLATYVFVNTTKTQQFIPILIGLLLGYSREN